MRNWELAKSQRGPEAPPPTGKLHPYVAISRTIGSGGTQVARVVAETLGWSFFDRELLDVMASDDDVRRRMYAIEDEHERGLFEDVLLSIGSGGPAQRDDYFHNVVRASVSLAARQPAVFVGRGVGYILPAPAGVTVRIVAAADHCDARYAVRRSLPMETARKERVQLEADRRKFLRKHFGHRTDDEASFDLTVAVDRIGQGEAVNLITTLVRSRFRRYFDAPPDS